MFGRKELVKGDEGVVVGFVGIAQGFVVVAYVETGKSEFVFDGVDGWLGNFTVKEIGGFAG